MAAKPHLKAPERQRDQSLGFIRADFSTALEVPALESHPLVCPGVQSNPAASKVKGR